MGSIDGDGDLDYIAGSKYTDENWIYKNDGTGVFTLELNTGDFTATVNPPLGSSSALAVADVDADGGTAAARRTLGFARL